MTDLRRVCDLSPAELFDAAIQASRLGWESGRWEVTIGAEDGRLVRVKWPTLVAEGRVMWAIVGRKQLVNVESEAA